MALPLSGLISSVVIIAVIGYVAYLRAANNDLTEDVQRMDTRLEQMMIDVEHYRYSAAQREQDREENQAKYTEALRRNKLIISKLRNAGNACIDQPIPQEIIASDPHIISR